VLFPVSLFSKRPVSNFPFEFFLSSWNPSVVVDIDTGEVDLTNVVMSHGRGFVIPNIKCFLCGNFGGLKIKCDHQGCRVTDGEKQLPTSFHVTCARQAGLEVSSKEIGRKTHFYGKSQGLIALDSFLKKLTPSAS
jgi:hypothetical protein